jgi:hypothetical protein
MFTKCFTHIIMVAMATYFFPIICVKRKIFKSNPFFFILFLKQKCKKNIRNVHKMLYTYYHGKKKWVWFENFSLYTNYWEKICCHGNHDNMCKTFCEHSWYFFLILTLKIIINKMGNWFEKFSFLTKMLGKICCHGNHDMCKTFYEHSGYFF